MRDIEWDGDSSYYAGGYDSLIASFEVQALLKVDDNNYQGDTRVLLRDGRRWGILIFGWGSCSGCDALEACGSRAEVVELRDEMWGNVHWELDAAAMLAYVRGKDWKLEFSYSAPATRVFLEKVEEWLAYFADHGDLPAEAIGDGPKQLTA